MEAAASLLVVGHKIEFSLIAFDCGLSEIARAEAEQQQQRRFMLR